MSKAPRDTLREILIGLFITIVGGVFVAWIIKEGELFQSGKQVVIAISIRNNDCNFNDFYIDGEKVVSSIAPNTTRALKTSSGEHWVQNCLSDSTTNCQDSTKIRWSSASEYIIPKSSTCPIDITLTNNDCKASDMYIDGVLVVSSLPSGNLASFQVAPGTHLVKVCTSGTDSCTEQNDTFESNGQRWISRATDCP